MILAKITLTIGDASTCYEGTVEEVKELYDWHHEVECKEEKSEPKDIPLTFDTKFNFNDVQKQIDEFQEKWKDFFKQNSVG